ncbi:MAG TPA: SDR family oxidoreductase [Solirubrobacteraceae bacterium]|jgi:3-oxoacyl-[acyl-carrier protein] reductase|nr:SDR family oxidoreductase [Solirubrobacteraceae bacterium]
MSARTALVTGCGNPRGIGVACVRELAAAGFAVAAHVAPGEELGDAPDTAFTADLADPTAPAALVDEVAARLGAPLVLVNNAAHSTRDGYAALDAATIDAHLAVNVRAPMLLSALVARGGGPGRIVNLISGQSLGPMPQELAYAASKGALETFTRQLAAEVAHLGITVNAVGPGPNDTGWIDERLRAELEPRFPTGRIGRPEDAARVVAWLCSDAAGWVTGQVIHAEGGFRRG